VALGRVLKAQGNKAAAFEVLSDAAFAAPNPAEALPELVREAEELRRLDAAVKLQAHLVAVVPQTTTEGLERLAQLQEKNLQPEEAAKTWARVVAKFPRDVPALEKAAEFERTWGTVERSIELLRRIRAIEPANPRALARLAELDIAQGNSDEAIECLEAALALTPPEKAGDPIRYPAVKSEDPSRLEIAYYSTVQRRRGKASPETLRALREFWFEKAAEPRVSDDFNTRLETIRDLAELIASSGDANSVARWVQRWQRPENGPERAPMGAAFRRRKRAAAQRSGEVDSRVTEATRRSMRSSGSHWKPGNSTDLPHGPAIRIARRLTGISSWSLSSTIFAMGAKQSRPP
jgi:tetratricopeptide (TPR) repeat protein